MTKFEQKAAARRIQSYGFGHATGLNVYLSIYSFYDLIFYT